uniref:Secreted protein n=1 Tax=Cannabis sativa TaxID=3483 RepID=A0A803R6D2_CANSA
MAAPIPPSPGGCCCSVPSIGFCFLCLLCSLCWEEDVSVCCDGALHSSYYMCLQPVYLVRGS